MEHKKILYEDIRLAVHGDSLAMQKVIRHFRPYIKDQSLKISETNSGDIYSLDDEKFQTIEARLMEAILKFDFSRIEGCEG